MNSILKHPLFWGGLIIRIVIVSYAYPAPVIEWYLPFLESASSTISIDPWDQWISQGGSTQAFPYGYVMYYVLLAPFLLASFLDIPVIFSYFFALLIADIALLLLLRVMVNVSHLLLLLVYWFSPIVVIATYLLGYNDIIPATLLFFSIYYIGEGRLLRSSVFFVLAVSAKLSMLIALPFYGIYLLNNKPLRAHSIKFVVGFLTASVVFILPFVLSSSGVGMLFNNSEMHKLYHLFIEVGGDVKIYIIPLIYFLMVYGLWRVKRLNFELFYSISGVAFLSVVLMTPASPGWFIWLIPFLVMFQGGSDKVTVILVSIFSVLYIVNTLLLSEVSGILSASYIESKVLFSVIHTLMLSIGVVLTFRIWRKTIKGNSFFRLSRRPFVLGVAGDSGAGKDTYVDAVCHIFGNHSVTSISGDDYHLWDRHKPMWQVMTHLNPMANDLERFASDLVMLNDGETINSRHYNHATGQMSKMCEVKSNDIIVASGLHALYLPILRDCYSLKIYLDIDEDLRRHFKLERDVKQRGHTLERVLESFARREKDSARFIRPQKAYADLIFSLQPIHPRMLSAVDETHPVRLKLIVTSKHGFNEPSLVRILVGVCGLHVDLVTDDMSEVGLTIEGEASAEDVEMAAKMLCPRMFEFLDLYPKWEDGMLGLMQLITLTYINQALTKRFI